MRGHETIVAMRRRGRRPGMVWLDTDGYYSGLQALARMGFPAQGHVELQPSDAPHRLDLRFLVGLLVEVSGSDERRVAAVARASVEAGARQVIAAWATTVPRGEEFETTTHRMTFTNEELALWPQ